MIQELNFNDVDNIKLLGKLLDKDLGRNYFIKLGLLDMNYFDKIWMVFDGDLMVGGIFLRKSGNLQVYIEENEKIIAEIAKFLQGKNYFKMIISRHRFETFMDIMKFGYFVKGTEISKFEANKSKKQRKLPEEMKIRKMELSDVDEVINLYKHSFKGFSSKERIIERLETGAGRGFVVENSENAIVAVAQTDFEEEKQCVIVGVATDRQVRRKGIASILVDYLIKELKSENKDIYIQYEEKMVGKFYEKLGFVKIDQLYDVYK
ncbi:MAG: GNAT family N-acetyltransferase [Firmicutes bacterium]|jgi:predicted GNAT family acetyltransferase|nr:GNAT family N-acetyltransferase [Bacillota bacterium]